MDGGGAGTRPGYSLERFRILLGSMRFAHVALEGLAHVLPERIVRSEELEERLGPVYERLGLRVGRLELMTGIAERRFWPAGTRPSSVAAAAAERALEESGVAREEVDYLIHASVCRDFLEPATASVVHASLGLSPHCVAVDLSNACLGFVNSMALLGQLIESGAIRTGLVVAGEDGRPLVEGTIERLLADPDVSRASIKDDFASLTIGCGAAAAVLRHSEQSASPHRLLGAAQRVATQHHALCSGDRAAEGEGLRMSTDSEAMLHAGVELAQQTFADFQRELGWERSAIERVVTHQVGRAHRKLLLERLELDEALDHPTVERLGNMGSVSVPITLDEARRQGVIQPGQQVACLGIGSGLQCQMLGLRLG